MIKVHRRPTARRDLPAGYQFGDGRELGIVATYIRPAIRAIVDGPYAWRSPSENRAEILRGVAQRITEHTLHAGEP